MEDEVAFDFVVDDGVEDKLDVGGWVFLDFYGLVLNEKVDQVVVGG